MSDDISVNGKSLSIPLTASTVKVIVGLIIAIAGAAVTVTGFVWDIRYSQQEANRSIARIDTSTQRQDRSLGVVLEHQRVGDSARTVILDNQNALRTELDKLTRRAR